MDCNMPNLDGWQATLQIRNELGYTGPIMGYTAYSNEADVKKCLEVGMDHVLNKPSDIKDIKEAIEKWKSLEVKVF